MVYMVSADTYMYIVWVMALVCFLCIKTPMRSTRQRNLKKMKFWAESLGVIVEFDVLNMGY